MSLYFATFKIFSLVLFLSSFNCIYDIGDVVYVIPFCIFSHSFKKHFVLFLTPLFGQSLFFIAPQSINNETLLSNLFDLDVVIMKNLVMITHLS
jgi:hypothetical protein